MTRKEALKQGYTIDTHCYPWVAYKGPRFATQDWQPILTDLESDLLTALKDLIDAQGVDHEDGCPGDDTCECQLVQRINTVILKAEPHD